MGRVGDQFTVLLDSLDAETLRDLQQLYADEAAATLARNAVQRQAIGYANRQDHRAINGLGAVTFAPTVTDYIWQQRHHNETFDNPKFRDWFTRRPEGEYARVDSGGTKMQFGFEGDPSKREFVKSYG